MGATKAGHEGSNVSGAKKYTGGCHCGAVRFEVVVDLDRGASRCNCSICTKVAQLATIVKPDAFELLTPEDALGVYAWGGQTGRRCFCKTCGVHCFGPGYLEELGGDYVSVNVNCLDDVDPAQVNVIYFDGRHNNWAAGPRSTPWPISATG